MSKVKLGTSTLNVAEALQVMQVHGEAMTGNANFVTPEPSVVDFTAARDALQAASLAYNTAKQELQNLLEARDAALATAKVVLSQRIDYVNLKSGGDPVKASSSGFSLRNSPAPVGPLPAPQAVVAIADEIEGNIKVVWEPVHGAASYQIEHTTDPNNPDSWVNHTSSTRSDTLFTGLTSGVKMWFRVRAFGTAGYGAWSDPTTKRVP